MSPPQEVWGLLLAGSGGLPGEHQMGARCGARGAVRRLWGGEGVWSRLGAGGGMRGQGGAECQGWELEETARSGAGTFSPELQHLPLMKHFITAALQGGHPIRDDKFPATALRSLAAAVILLHLE